jgi:hypothetical protein
MVRWAGLKENSCHFKGVCDEGRFIEDTFAAEYFAGILSSRAPPKVTTTAQFRFLR